ncbi:MAG TPA: hypothetical protein VFR76_12475 [Verrucomicrobiae bacterium]|nr:hypothetical protein [Verrucomicrobiae bacterium]
MSVGAEKSVGNQGGGFFSALYHAVKSSFRPERVLEVPASAEQTSLLVPVY